MSAKLFKNGEAVAVTAFAPFLTATSDAAATLPNSSGAATPFIPPPMQNVAGPQTSALRSGPLTIPHTPQSSHETNPNGPTEADINLLLAEAQAEAEALVADANAQAAEIEREARERGLAEARMTVAAEIDQQVQQVRAQMMQTIEELAGLRVNIAQQAEQELVRLAIEIAKKIVHREVAADHEIALTLARVALSRLHARALATVHLHPVDYAYVQMHRDRLGVNSAIELVEDRSIGRGGCLVRSEMGDVDARIEQQFAEIERSFLGT